jgi:predicted permease
MTHAFDGLRYVLRQLRQSPVFTAAAVLTLSLGIGGTTAIFTLIHAVMLRSLPVADPARLYRIGDTNDCCVNGGPQDRWGLFPFPLFEQLKANAPQFEELAAFQAGGARLGVRRGGRPDAARPLRGEFVTGNYFATFGIGSFAGRVFTRDDDAPAAAPVAVLSHRAWQVEYGSDPSVVGGTFIVQGHPLTVVGVAPPGFFGETLRGDPPDIWLPLNVEPLIDGDTTLLHQTASAWLRVIGRLRPGASVEGLGPHFTGVIRNWIRHESPYPADWFPDLEAMLQRQVVYVVPAGAGVGVMKEEYGRSLQILLAVCGLVLLIACANVANLMLARAAAQRGQVALRLALGASRWRIVSQALLESVILAVAGASAGLLVARGAARLLLDLAFQGAHFVPINASPSPLVLAFAFGLALLTGILFGAAPAWFATRTDPIESLRGAGRSTRDHSSVTRNALLVVQATLSVVLVAGATLLGRSLNHLEAQDFGYAVNGRVVVTLNRAPSTYTVPMLASMNRQILERVNRLPGVTAAGLALYNPLVDNWSEPVYVAGHAPLPANQDGDASWDRVSAGYLPALGVRVLRGRGFTDADNEDAAPVALVNEAFLRRFFKTDEEPLGQHFGIDMPENAGTYRIVGVVRDAKFAGWGLDQPARPMFYVPLAQRVEYSAAPMKRVEVQSHFIGGMALVTDLGPGALEPVLTKTLADVDPNLTVASIRTMREQVARSFDQERAVASLAGLFGVVALVLAAVGLYGVMAYTVTRRTGEIGIRMALGADRRKVIGLVLRSAFRRVMVGLVVGIPLAVGAGRLIAAQLYGVTFWDPLALAVAAGALAVSAFIAALIPAIRAASIQPMTALRAE